jgi:hypothetical protein
MLPEPAARIFPVPRSQSTFVGHVPIIVVDASSHRYSCLIRKTPLSLVERRSTRFWTWLGFNPKFTVLIIGLGLVAAVLEGVGLSFILPIVEIV